MISGTSSKKLDQFPLSGHICSSCKSSNTTDLIISAGYFHVFWIPAVSTGKQASLKCSKCSHETEEENLPESARKLFSEKKPGYRAPLSHWSLSVVLGTLLLISFLFSVTGNAEVDAREALLEKDLEVLDSAPLQKGDELAGKILTALKSELDPSFKAEEYSCLTRSKDSSVLILLKAPNYNKLEEDQISALTEAVDAVLEKEVLLKDKKIYLGILSMFDLKSAKTPDKQENGPYLSQLALYDYYGKKAVK